MLPKAYIVHQIRNRLRLRIPERCQDSDYFDMLEEQLTSLSLFSGVEVSPVIASILLEHPFLSYDAVRPELERLGLFDVIAEKPPAVRPMEAVTAKLGRTDSLINEISSGGFDLRTLAFVIAMLMTLQQAARGNFSGPAIPMFLAALSLVTSNGGNFPGAGAD